MSEKIGRLICLNQHNVNSTKEEYISEMEAFAVGAALRHGYYPIIDATNLNPVTFKKWTDYAKEADVACYSKRFVISYEEVIRRDSERENGVGKKVIDRFFRDYFPEEYKEAIKDKRYIAPIIEDEEKMNAYICDLDGTIAIHSSGRNPYDYNMCGEDTCDERLKALLLRLKEHGDHIVYVSGRKEYSREESVKWLRDNGIFSYGTDYLCMRRDDDDRPDEVVKKEIYENDIKERFNIFGVFDDRDKVVKMWRELGLLCMQVYYGDF